MTKTTITLSDRPPVQINKDAWPSIASASWHDGQVECQANRKRWIRVRRHQDGRHLVYGHYSSAFQNERDTWAGYLIGNGDALVTTIQMVAKEIGDADLARECVSQLPPEEI